MKTTSFRRAFHRAFTLLELLVVFAIIGVLAAILLGVLPQFRRHGESSASLSNMRQIGSAFFAYTQDHDGALPGRLGGNVDKWPKLLSYYLTSVKVYAAPGDPQNYLRRKIDPVDNGRNNTSYIMNGFNDVGAFDTDGFAVRLASIERPAATLLLGTIQPGSIHYYMDFREKNQEDMLAKKLYGDGSTYLFCDGSAKFITEHDYRNELWLVDKEDTEIINQPM